MDRNEKFLKKLSTSEFDAVAKALLLIRMQDSKNLNITKLAGQLSVYRVRVGKVRKSSLWLQIQL